MRRVWLCLAILVATVTLGSLLRTPGIGFSASGRAQQGNSEQSKKWQTLSPVDEAVEPVDTHQRSLRESKSRRYNSTRSDQVLTEQPADVIFGRIDESPRPSALPIAESDAVILGTVISVQPYLAENKTSIYTEFRIRVEEAFKRDVPAYMTAGDVVTADQEGGALRLKNGRVLRYFVGGTSRLPSLDARYVLFLILTHNHQNLAILTGYELRNGRVISLEEDGDRSPYANFDDGKFLEKLRTAMAQGSISLEMR